MTTTNSMNAEQAAILRSLDTTRILKVYSGKPGCGCGCRGNYSEANGQKTRVLKALLANIDDVQFLDAGDELIFSLESETRYRWIYVAQRHRTSIEQKAAARGGVL